MNEPGSSNPGFDPSAHAPGVRTAREQVEAARLRIRELIASGRLTNSPLEPAPPGKSLPGYRLLRELHRGGQGVVYVAIQESTGREVAVKLLRGGALAGSAELARFQREVEVLGKLKHPHIVTIHDCGRSGDEVFLVMDYVAGRPLDTHIGIVDASKTQKIEIEGVLRLFAKICDGVNAAHLRGVIHRDLKPTNIRVDEQGEPRVLDFGLAKLVSEESESSSAQAMTLTGQFVGSLPWASPEQVERRSDTLDVRTDVYSLGVILYQLLTGRFPYPVAGRMDEVVHHIAKSSPDRPSTIQGAIGHEVETILLKCLAKEPERRYQSAGELARDIRHYLSGEPIEAKRDSLTYVLGKQLRRHWVPVSVGAAFLLLLAGGLAASLTNWYRAEHALKEAEAQGQLAEQQRSLADARAAETNEVAEYLADMLSRVDVEAMGRGIRDRYREQVRAAFERQYVGEAGDRRLPTAAEVDAKLVAYDDGAAIAHTADVARQVMHEFMLKPAAEGLSKQFPDQPLVQGQLHHAIGSAYQSLGMFEAAEPVLRAALEERRRQLGEEHVLVAESLNELANLLQAKGDYSAAEPLYRESLAMRRKLLGEEHVDVARTMSNFGELLRAKGDEVEAENLHRQAVALHRRLLGSEHPELVDTLGNLGVTLHSRGLGEESVAVYREALELARRTMTESDPRRASVAASLAGVLNENGKHHEAEGLLREALDLRRKSLGNDHPDVGQSLNNLAYTLHKKADFAAAERLYREALALRRKLLGDAHPDVARSLNNLAVVLSDQGKFDEAEPAQREALALRRQTLGDRHADVAKTINNLAILLQRKGDLEGAESMFREALSLRRQTQGENHPDVARGMANLAGLLSERGKFAEAESLHRESLAMRRRLLGDEHPDVAAGMNNLAGLLGDRGDLESAEALHRQALALSRKLHGDKHPNVAVALSNIASILVKRSDFAAAEPMYREALAIEESTYKGDHPDKAQSMFQLAGVLIELNRASDAEPYAREAVAMTGRLFKSDHRLTAAALSTLALYQHRTGQSADAIANIAQATEMILRLFPPEHHLCKSVLERRTRILGGDMVSETSGAQPATSQPGAAGPHSGAAGPQPATIQSAMP